MELITATLISNKKLTNSIFELRINAPEYTFQSGQYVMVQIPQEPKPKMAAFSIASDEREVGLLRLLIRDLKDSPTTQYLSQLKPQSPIHIAPAKGDCLFKTPVKKNVFFFCTGTGLAQHISYIHSNRERFPEAHMCLWIEVRDEEDIYLESELQEIKESSSHFNYEFILKSPKTDWKGKSGSLIDHISSLVFKPQDTQVYLCGRPDMVTAANTLLKSKGLNSENIIFESY